MKLVSLLKKIYIKALSKDGYIKYLQKNGVTIGKECDISKSALFGSEPYLISIGDRVRITRNVQFITHDGGLWVLRNLKLTSEKSDKMGKIVIGNNVNIGWNAVIMPNVHIGDNVIIGVGAIVTKDVPSNCVVSGVPAKEIETIEEYYNKNKESFIETKHMNYIQKKDFINKYLK